MNAQAARGRTKRAPSGEAASGFLDACIRAAWIPAAFVPAFAALTHAALVDDGARDEVLLRALGLASAGTPSLDGLLAAPFLALPVGTLVFRLALASSVAVGVGGAALFLLGRALAGRVMGGGSERFAGFVALVGSLATTLSRPWQLEGAAPLGSVVGAAVLLAGLVWAAPVMVSLDGDAGPRLPQWWNEPKNRRIVVAALLGVLAFGAYWILRTRMGTLRFASSASMHAGPDWVLDHFERARLIRFLTGDVGVVTTSLAAVGFGFGVVRRGARPPAMVMGAIALLALFVTASGSFDGPERFHWVALVAQGMADIFAAAGLAVTVRWVSTLRVPFAAASASMIALLGAAFPAMAWDESSLAHDVRLKFEELDWAETCLGGLSDDTLTLTDDPAIAERLAASMLTGEAPARLSVVPLYDVGGRWVRREISRTPDLVPLVRDVTLTGFPTELALSNLAASHRVAMAYSARWDSALSRHLVPDAILDRFQPEPHGVADRRKAIEATEVSMAATARMLSNVTSATMGRSTARFLKARANALAGSGDKELAFHVIEQARAFSPNDDALDAMAKTLRETRGFHRPDLARR